MYRNLNPAAIIETIAQLRGRIQERFPGSSLGKLADELNGIGRESVDRAAWISRPHIPLRIGIGCLILLLVALVGMAVRGMNVPLAVENFAELVQAIDAAVNEIILLGAGIYFLFSLESRIKRDRALKAIHELRSLAHIIDMHQLTKDPERVVLQGPDTASSPRRTMTNFELSRYLDYCSEMLALIGKIGALYVQHFQDPVALGAVDEIEDLTTGLSRKIWQKIMIVNQNEGLAAEMRFRSGQPAIEDSQEPAAPTQPTLACGD